MRVDGRAPDKLRALRVEDEQLHERVGELISALKGEQIFAPELRELAREQHPVTAEKLMDLADIYEQMLELCGGSLLDGRDQEKLAQQRLGFPGGQPGALPPHQCQHDSYSVLKACP